jgi:hypothetical protein
VGGGRESGLLLPQGRIASLLWARTFSPREKDPQEKRGSEPQPEREAALPTPTQGP